MSHGYRLYIVTDTPAKAAQYFFGHGLDLVPAWTKIVSTIDEIAAIPNGARAVGVWFVPFDLRHERFIIRRWEVNITGDHFEVLDAIRAWQAKKALQPANEAQPNLAPASMPQPEASLPDKANAPPHAPSAHQKPAAPRWK